MLPLARYLSFRSGFTLTIALLLSIVLTKNGMGQVPHPECFVELPVFDAVGNPVHAEIVAVQFEEGGANLLVLGNESLRGLVIGDRLYFPKAWLSKSLIQVTVKAPSRRLKKSIELTSCEQRTSLRMGQRDTGADVNVSTIQGRISGCQLDKNWWVRAMPMFDGQDGLSVYEGYIRTDNSFSITAHIRGERHILIVGRGRQPIIAIGADVISGGGKTDVGTLDLSKVCPK